MGLFINSYLMVKSPRKGIQCFPLPTEASYQYTLGFVRAYAPEEHFSPLDDLQHSLPRPPPTPKKHVPLITTAPQADQNIYYIRTKKLKAQGLVESIRRRLVLGGQSGNHGLGTQAGVLGGLVGLANVGELVADAVGNDVGVKGVLLALGDEGVGRQEGALGVFAAGAPKNEVHCRRALAEIRTGEARRAAGISVGVACRRVRGGVGVRGRRRVVVACRAIIAGVIVTGIRISIITGSGSVGGSTSVGGSATGSGLVAIGVHNSEVAKALGNHDVGNREAGRVERAGQRGGRVGILGVGPRDVRVDQGNDAAELLGGWQGGVSADGGDGDVEGVEVLLGGHDGGRTTDDGRVGAQGADDLVGQGELDGWIDGGQQTGDPNKDEMKTDRRTLSQGLAAASKTPGTAPARVAASPGLPKSLRAETWDTGTCSWLKRASARAARRVMVRNLDMVPVL